MVGGYKLGATAGFLFWIGECSRGWSGSGFYVVGVVQHICVVKRVVRACLQME